MQTPTPFSVVGTRRTYVPVAHRKCYFVQWASNIYTSVVFGRVGGVSNVFVLFHYMLWKAKLDLTALGEGLDSWASNVSSSTGSIASCGVMKTLLALYGSIFASILLVKVVPGMG